MPLNSLRDTLMTNPSCRSYLSCKLLISSRYLLGILCGTVFSITSGQSLTWRSDIKLSFLSDNIILGFIHISSFRGIWTAKQTFFRRKEGKGGEKSKQPDLFLGESRISFYQVVPGRCPRKYVHFGLYPCDVNNIKWMIVCNMLIMFITIHMLTMLCI